MTWAPRSARTYTDFFILRGARRRRRRRRRRQEFCDACCTGRLDRCAMLTMLLRATILKSTNGDQRTKIKEATERKG